MLQARRQFKSLFTMITLMLTMLMAVVMAIIMFGIYLTVVDVSGASMSPTLHHGQLICANTGKTPKVGDLVVVDMDETLPGEGNYIKRLIGLGGDKITLRIDGDVVNVLRNEELLNESYVAEKISATKLWVPVTIVSRQWRDEIDENGIVTITVPNGEYFLLGDNRNHSSDSRAFGTVKERSLVSVVVDISPLAEHTQTILTLGKLLGIFVFIIFIFFGESILYTGGRIYENSNHE